MQLRSDSFAAGQPIPARFAFGQPAVDAPVRLSDNHSPQLAWRDAPTGTRSFLLTCIDPDVPSRGDDVNQPGRTVPADLPRVEFVHWLMADIPAECGELAAGAWLEVKLPPPPVPPAPVAERVPGMGILYEDEDIVVVDKPTGVAAHPTTGWTPTPPVRWSWPRARSRTPG